MIKINGILIENNKFPDGTPLFTKMPIFKDEKCIKFTWLFNNNEEMLLLYMLVKHYKTMLPQNTEFILHMPYVPNARMDRVKSKEEVFTLKHFSEFINDMNFDKVIVFDVHSNVSLALINRVESDMCISNVILNAINKSCPEVLLFPDEGSCKRYSDILINNPDFLNKKIDITFANKKRDWSTGQILGLTIQDGEKVKDKNVLIIDDICSKGTTFLYSAKALKQYGAKEIYLYISHCENSIYSGEMFHSDLIKKIYTTNSILTSFDDKIEIIKEF